MPPEPSGVGIVSPILVTPDGKSYALRICPNFLGPLRRRGVEVSLDHQNEGVCFWTSEHCLELIVDAFLFLVEQQNYPVCTAGISIRACVASSYSKSARPAVADGSCHALW